MSSSSKAIAWAVHAYTALGLVGAAVMAVLILDGRDAAFRWTFGLMIAVTLIDATDGRLARAVRVKEVLPEFDGSVLDNLIDFQTYTSLPLLLLWRAETLGSASWLLLVPLLASAWGFSQAHAKIDGLFRGFPSYWNLVSFYLYFLAPPIWLSVAVILAGSVLTFVPTYYIDASKGGRFARAIGLGAVVWCVVVTLVLTGRVDDERAWVMASLILPAGYVVCSAIVSSRRR